MTRYTTLPTVKALQDETLMYAAIVGLVAIGIAFLVSLAIAYKGGEDKSYIKRRIWFIIIGIASAVGFYVYNDLVVKPNITNVGFQSMFSRTNLTGTGICLALYFVVGIILMFIFRHTKFGSILGRSKDA